MWNKDYEITEFLLVDDYDYDIKNSYLVIFEEPISKNRVEKIVKAYKENKYEQDLTDEYVFDYLDKLGVNFKIIWLGKCEKIYY